MLQSDVCKCSVANYRDGHRLVDSLSLVPREKACIGSHASPSKKKKGQRGLIISRMVDWYIIMTAASFP